MCVFVFVCGSFFLSLFLFLCVWTSIIRQTFNSSASDREDIYYIFAYMCTWRKRGELVCICVCLSFFLSFCAPLSFPDIVLYIKRSIHPRMFQYRWQRGHVRLTSGCGGVWVCVCVYFFLSLYVSFSLDTSTIRRTSFSLLTHVLCVLWFYLSNNPFVCCACICVSIQWLLIWSPPLHRSINTIHSIHHSSYTPFDQPFVTKCVSSSVQYSIHFFCQNGAGGRFTTWASGRRHRIQGNTCLYMYICTHLLFRDGTYRAYFQSSSYRSH